MCVPVPFYVRKAEFSYIKVRTENWLKNQSDNNVINKLLNKCHVVNGGIVHNCDAPRRDIHIKWAHFREKVINAKVKKMLAYSRALVLTEARQHLQQLQ